MTALHSIAVSPYQNSDYGMNNSTHTRVKPLKKCNNCGEWKPHSDFYKHLTSKDNLQYSCKNCMSKRNIEYQRQVRNKVLKRVGDSACVQCGYSENVWALQIDHIHGGGVAERESFVSHHSYYKYLLELPIEELKRDYQILCANCNAIKRHDNKEYHKLSFGSPKELQPILSPQCSLRNWIP